jgi:hypothetical protein
LHAEGLFLAEADGVETVAGKAEADEVLLDGVGAAITKREVVFGGAAFVAMAFDRYANLRIVFEEVGGFAQGNLCIGANLRGVIVEISVANFFKKEFVMEETGATSTGAGALTETRTVASVLPPGPLAVRV